jgi:superoxide dismutase
MTFAMKPLSCDPSRIRGMSERLIVSHYENNLGKAVGGGSGWVLLSWSPRDRRLVNQWASDHCHSLAGGTPILALDMYEHSYHIDFGAKAATYVDTFMDAIRWDNVGRLYAAAAGGAGGAIGA